MARPTPACGGVIFLVNAAMERECMERGLGALPGGQRLLAESVATGAPIFVYNTSSKAREAHNKRAAAALVAHASDERALRLSSCCTASSRR
jgi:hypothetical protein